MVLFNEEIKTDQETDPLKPTDNFEGVSLQTIEPYSAQTPTPTTVTGVDESTQTGAEIYQPGTEGTVKGQLAGILSAESPYIQGARERGRQYAHSRGLLSSSMAAGAAEKSAIESALPIAQQDASTFSQAGLQKQKFDEEKALINTQADAASRISAQESEQALMLEREQQQGANYRQAQEIALNERLSAADISLKEKESIANQMAILGDNFQAKLAGIQVDPNLGSGAKTAAIKDLQSVYEANLSSLGSIYGVEIVWDTNLTPQIASESSQLQAPTARIGGFFSQVLEEARRRGAVGV